MNNSLTKFAASAVVLIACITGLTIFKGTSNIALGDVLEHIKQVNAVFYQQKMNQTIPMMGMEMKLDTKSRTWISQDYGMRMDMEMAAVTGLNPSEPNTLTQSYLLPKQNKIITIMPNQKQYGITEFDSEQALEARQERQDPNLMVEQFLDCNYISLGKSIIDGIEVEGFQTTDPNFQGGIYSSGQVDAKLWVDVKTKLPVKMEMDVQISEQNMKIHSVTYGFQWDVPVDASIFEPVIPDDYTSATSSSIQMSFNEDGVIKGLKLYKDSFEKYPEKLDLAGLTAPFFKILQQIPELAKSNNTENLSPYLKKMKEELEGLSEQEQRQKSMDLSAEISSSISGLSSFHKQLVQEKKEPAYYGDIITPDDAGQVLMRWKVSDNEYRVIFGNLYAETVTADVLAELEKNLPQ